MVVWKFTLAVNVNQTILMPMGARILHVAAQHDEICMWALCSPTIAKELRTFHVFGTGHQIDHLYLSHRGTVLLAEGRFVLHVFEDMGPV